MREVKLKELYYNPILHDIIVPKRYIDVELIQKIVDRKTDNLKICVFIDDFAFHKKVYITRSESTVIQRKTCGYHPIICSQFFLI